MGETAHLKLKTISETDDMPVKDFFQALSGDISTSNMQKIDTAFYNLSLKEGVLSVRYNLRAGTITHSAEEIDTFINQGGDVLLVVEDLNMMTFYKATSSSSSNIIFSLFQTYHRRELEVTAWSATMAKSSTPSNPQIVFFTSGVCTKTAYDPENSISEAGGIAAWISKTYENAEVTKY